MIIIFLFSWISIFFAIFFYLKTKWKKNKKPKRKYTRKPKQINDYEEREVKDYEERENIRKLPIVNIIDNTKEEVLNYYLNNSKV